MDWDPNQVFNAAIRLSQTPYAGGLYWHWKTSERPYEGLEKPAREKRRLEMLEYNPISHPVQNLGTIWTTGGLAIHTHRARPYWIETPWGEWPCWDLPWWGGTHHFGPVDTLARLRDTLQLDEERRESGDIWPIRGIGDITLPPYAHDPKQNPRPIDEWAELCLAHDPPVPISEHARWLLNRRKMA